MSTGLRLQYITQSASAPHMWVRALSEKTLRSISSGNLQWCSTWFQFSFPEYLQCVWVFCQSQSNKETQDPIIQGNCSQFQFRTESKRRQKLKNVELASSLVCAWWVGAPRTTALRVHFQHYPTARKMRSHQITFESKLQNCKMKETDRMTVRRFFTILSAILTILRSRQKYSNSFILCQS